MKNTSSNRYKRRFGITFSFIMHVLYLETFFFSCCLSKQKSPFRSHFADNSCFPTLEGLLSSSTEGIFTKRDIHNLQWLSYTRNFFEATNPSTESTSLENVRWVFRLSSSFWNDTGYEKKSKRTISLLNNVEVHTDECPWKSSNF